MRNQILTVAIITDKGANALTKHQERTNITRNILLRVIVSIIIISRGRICVRGKV
ncbi:hypothetical protein LINGRAHAP2_LOCUS31027 [Linum grandiflorum]